MEPIEPSANWNGIDSAPWAAASKTGVAEAICSAVAPAAVKSPTETPASIEIQPLPETSSQPQGVTVGRGQVTQGWSNPFGGTSWGV